MILGIFGGVTPSSIHAKIERLEKMKDTIRGTIAQARADRIAALAEIKNDLAALDSAQSRL